MIPFNQVPGTNFHDVNLDWIINQVKAAVADWTATKADWVTTEEAWADVQEAWTELQSYVENYFANLDVSQEINAKIDAMVEDGSFLTIIQNTVSTAAADATPDAVTAWLAEHVVQETGYVLDDTLTVEDAAADAKAAGAAIAKARNDQAYIDAGNGILPQLFVYVNTSSASATYMKVVDNTKFRTVCFPVTSGTTYHIHTQGYGDTTTLGSSYGINRFLMYYYEADPIANRTLTGVNVDNTATTGGNSFGRHDTYDYYYTAANTGFIVLSLAYGNSDPNIFRFVVTVGININGQECDLNGVPLVSRTNNLFIGKTFSVIGDSISAFAGDIPDGNLAYYTGNNSGVSNKGQMWYNLLAGKLGMKLLVNNSWSGSRVCNPDYDPETEATPASLPSRCQALDAGGVDPDIVLIAMGLNDWSNSTPLAGWDGRNLTDNDNFLESYIIMLSRIHQEYPGAKIYCIGPWFSQRETLRTVTLDGVTTPCVRSWAVGAEVTPLTREDYAEVIRKVCLMCDATFIDGNVGFNENNFYPTYCNDGALNDHYTHPNAAGHQIMAIIIAERLIRNV